MISLGAIQTFFAQHVLMPNNVREHQIRRLISIQSILIFVGTYLLAAFIGGMPLFAPIGLAIQDALVRIHSKGRAEYTRVVGIEQGDYESVFKGRSPLNPAELQEAIEKLLQYKPAVLAIDLDTSASTFTGHLPLDGNGRTELVWARDIDVAPKGELSKPGAIAGQPDHEPRHSGITLYPLDLDGKTRKFPTFVELGSRRQATFHWAIVKAYCENRSSLPCSLVSKREEDATMSRLRFRERPELYHPFATIWQNTSAPPDDNMFRDRVVILGAHYLHHDIHSTPLGTLYGVEVIGQAVESELTNDRIFEPASWEKHTLKATIGLLIVWLNYILRPFMALTASVFLIGGVVFSSAMISLFYLGSVWLDASIFFIAILIEQIVQGAETAQHMLEHSSTAPDSANEVDKPV